MDVYTQIDHAEQDYLLRKVKTKAYNKKYREENIDVKRTYDKVYALNNKEKVLVHKEKWIRNNKEYMKTYHKKYHEENREEINAYHRKRSKERRSEKPFHSRLTSLRSSAKKRNLQFNLKVSDLEDLWEKQNGLCFYSKKKMDLLAGDKKNTFSVDRIDSTKGYIVNNVVLCRWIVNLMKNDMNVDEFINEVKILNENMK